MALDYGLRDRVALVTGAASGIGARTAHLLAGMGAKVVACDVDAAAGEAGAAELRATGATVRFVGCVAITRRSARLTRSLGCGSSRRAAGSWRPGRSSAAAAVALADSPVARTAMDRMWRAAMCRILE